MCSNTEWYARFVWCCAGSIEAREGDRSLYSDDYSWYRVGYRPYAGTAFTGQITVTVGGTGALCLTDTSCTKRQLLSLVDKLAFACKVIPAGRIFLRWLLDLAHSHSTMDSLIHISDEALQDVLWWKKFASSWNGVAFFLDPTWTPASELQLYTDASGTLGFGGYWNGAWFSQPWPPHLAAKPIEWKELYAVVIACEVWGSHWSGKRILFHCDNLAIVHIWESGLSRCSDLMYLVRALFFVAISSRPLASGLGHAHFQLKAGQWVSSQVSYASHIFVGYCWSQCEFNHMQYSPTFSPKYPCLLKIRPLLFHLLSMVAG